jgi:methylated-DNA-protein-cysteine methyltransferase-like protein
MVPHAGDVTRRGKAAAAGRSDHRTGSAPGPYEAIFAIVRRIPRGRVASYGQVAELAGLPGHARQVGYALHAAPDELRLPWHRVVNARGEIVVRDRGAVPTLAPSRQRTLLEHEGVGFDSHGRVVLSRHGWKPRGRR